MTKHYGILAYPAKHSLSPVMHDAAFKAAGIDAQYAVFEVPDEGLADFLQRVRQEPIDGVSVSLPHKVRIMEFLDEIDENARKIGAVNTVVNRGGVLYGYNTDYVGSNMALEEVVENLDGKEVVVFGAGGAGRAIVYGLMDSGAKVSIYNRTPEKAHSLAEEFSEIFGEKIVSGSWDDMMRIEKVDIVVQASSIWTLNPSISANMLRQFLPMNFTDKFDVVMDIVYKPLITPLLELAQEAGKKIITGDKMLLYQAVEQFRLWTDTDPSMEAMKEALNANV